MNEAQRNGANPEYLSIGTMLKARPSEEKGERFIYLEASREGVDQQNDVVLAKALEDSAEHFLKFGNIDIDHKSMPTVAKMYGIEDPESWEVGVPEEVIVNGGTTMVKARLFQGDTPLAARANMVWDSMTKLSPAARWYASVGGATLAKSAGIDPNTKAKVNYVTRVRWSNLAISRQPVNQHVSAASTIPFGVLAKCWTPDGFDMTKALEAGYGTDVATLTGGAALGTQSLDSSSPGYFQFRDVLSACLQEGRDPILQTSKGMTAFAVEKFGLSPAVAAEWVDRFISDIKKSITKRGSE